MISIWTLKMHFLVDAKVGCVHKIAYNTSNLWYKAQGMKLFVYWKSASCCYAFCTCLPVYLPIGMAGRLLLGQSNLPIYFICAPPIIKRATNRVLWKTNFLFYGLKKIDFPNWKCNFFSIFLISVHFYPLYCHSSFNVSHFLDLLA